MKTGKEIANYSNGPRGREPKSKSRPSPQPKNAERRLATRGGRAHEPPRPNQKSIPVPLRPHHGTGGNPRRSTLAAACFSASCAQRKMRPAQDANAARRDARKERDRSSNHFFFIWSTSTYVSPRSRTEDSRTTEKESENVHFGDPPASGSPKSTSSTFVSGVRTSLPDPGPKTSARF